jgi:hypothetical protein
MKKYYLILSITLNIIFLLSILFKQLNSPSFELGRLEKDIEIGVFSSNTPIFIIPKGITVRNRSERGIGAIGQFENERFELVITSDDPEIVNYALPKDSLQTFGNYYSSEIKK